MSASLVCIPFRIRRLENIELSAFSLQLEAKWQRNQRELFTETLEKIRSNFSLPPPPPSLERFLFLKGATLPPAPAREIWSEGKRVCI